MLAYCLKRNRNTKNIGSKKVAMTNKMVTAKSKCAYCMANNQDF